MTDQHLTLITLLSSIRASLADLTPEEQCEAFASLKAVESVLLSKKGAIVDLKARVAIYVSEVGTVRETKKSVVREVVTTNGATVQVETTARPPAFDQQTAREALGDRVSEFEVTREIPATTVTTISETQLLAALETGSIDQETFDACLKRQDPRVAVKVKQSAEVKAQLS